jgi:hypothetical protein
MQFEAVPDPDPLGLGLTSGFEQLGLAQQTCDHQLCQATTHNLQKKAIDDMTKAALLSVRQLLEGLMDERWIKYIERHLALIDLEGFTFDPFDHERLYVYLVNKMLDTPILYVGPHKKCQTSLDFFIVPLRQILDALNCDTPAEVSAQTPRVKLQVNLARPPLSPSVFLDLQNCAYMCEPALETLLTVPAVHEQLLDQMENKMPAMLAIGRAPPSKSPKSKAKMKRRGFFSMVEE